MRVSDRHCDCVRHDVAGRIALAHTESFASGAVTKDLSVYCRPPVLSDFKILKNESCRSFGEDDAIS